VPCPKCAHLYEGGPNKYIYCSTVCQRQDYASRHLNECGGGPGNKAVYALDPAEIRQIEKSTPFIKLGALKSADKFEDEKLLASMSLEDLDFADKKSIGKGSYGVV